MAEKTDYALLKSYVKNWQKSLGLMNWNVYYRFTDDIKCYGRTSIYPMCSEIRMEFADPERLDLEDGIGVKDLEVTVVHELLHVRLHYAVYHDKIHHDHVEQAIESIALGMVASKRNIRIEDIE